MHKEFVAPGQIVSEHFYLKVLDWLQKQVIIVYPEIVKMWILHHDNASCLQFIAVFDV